MKPYRLRKVIGKLTKSLKFKTIIFAIISTICTFFAWLWWNDRDIILGNEEMLMKKKSIISMTFGEDFASIPEDYLFINTGNDLQLVDVFEDNDGIPFPLGNTFITDREKLAKLFQLLSESQDYKYIFFDILLDKKYATPFDSLLVNSINSTPRLVYAMHDTPLLDGLSSAKAGKVAYSTTLINGDFCKYKLMDDRCPSMAYKAYLEIFPDMDRHVPKSFMPVLYFNKKNRYSESPQQSDNNSYEADILNLGVDVLNPYVDFKELIKDKYIFIGNYGDYDMHFTYLDKMDGIQIHANVFANLMKRNHTHHPLVIVVMIAVIFTFYIILFSRNKTILNPGRDSGTEGKVGNYLQKILDNRFVKIILSFVTVGLFFSALFFFFLITTDRIVEVSSLTILFILLWNLPENRFFNSIKHLFQRS